MKIEFKFAIGQKVVDECSKFNKYGEVVGATFTEKGIFYSLKGSSGDRWQAKEGALTCESQYKPHVQGVRLEPSEMA